MHSLMHSVFNQAWKVSKIFVLSHCGFVGSGLFKTLDFHLQIRNWGVALCRQGQQVGCHESDPTPGATQNPAEDGFYRMFFRRKPILSVARTISESMPTERPRQLGLCLWESCLCNSSAKSDAPAATWFLEFESYWDSMGCDSQSKMIKDLGGFNDVMQHSEPMWTSNQLGSPTPGWSTAKSRRAQGSGGACPGYHEVRWCDGKKGHHRSQDPESAAHVALLRDSFVHKVGVVVALVAPEKSWGVQRRLLGQICHLAGKKSGWIDCNDFLFSVRNRICVPHGSTSSAWQAEKMSNRNLGGFSNAVLWWPGVGRYRWAALKETKSISACALRSPSALDINRVKTRNGNSK